MAIAGGTFALYSVICRHARVSLIPNHQAEDRELSTYKLATPSKRLKRAESIKQALEQSKAAKIVLLMLTLMGTSMVIGDAILTHSISGTTLIESPSKIKYIFNALRFKTLSNCSKYTNRYLYRVHDPHRIPVNKK